MKIIESIATSERLLVTLLYCATGDAQKTIAAKYIISQSTMCRIITETRDAIWTVLKRKEFLTCPFMEEEWKGISQGLD